MEQRLNTPSPRKVKTPVKFAALLLLAGAVIFGLKLGVERGLIPGAGILKSMTVAKSELPDIRESQVEGVEPAPYPSDTPADVAGPQVRFKLWAWNTQMGLIYANGGAVTAKNSLMAKHDVNLKLEWQDDTAQMTNDLLSCAKELADQEECGSGAQFMAIMGDQTAAFFAGNNPNFKKLCADCTLEWVGSAGRSDGEDALMGPPAWKEDPQSAKGGVVAAVIREGDWNIVIKWAADNQLPINPDETTYDPGAVNFINAGTYVEAAEKYVAGYCEDRKVAESGRLTGEKKHVCIDGVATWTPADVTIAKNKGGLVRIVSTHQYRGQMPNAIIGIKKWNQKHAKIVAHLLAAMFEGGDQVRAFPESLKRAGELSNQLYGAQQTGDYWVRYYKGVKEEDASGNVVDLGGSKVFGLNDNLNVFGLAPGSISTAKATYNTFGTWVKTLYPKLVPDFPKYEEVVNTRYLQQAKTLVGKSAEAETAHFSTSTQLAGVVSRKTIYVQFDVDQASLRPEGREQLRQLADELAVGSGLVVLIHGYTDSTGDPGHNQELSEARARAVKQYLTNLAPNSFPSGNFRAYGHGQDDPIAGNDTANGRARNRRVQIVLANPKET